MIEKIFKSESQIPFFRPYKDDQKKKFIRHLKYFSITTIILFSSLYTPSLIKFADKITIEDWPLPQNDARNASTLYSTNQNEKELFTFFDINLRSYLPTVMDLLIFYLSLSIDTIITGNSPSKLSFIYNWFGLIKNSIVIITVLNIVQWNFTTLGNYNTNGMNFIEKIFYFIYYVLLKSMPLYNLKALLFLPNVIALLKLTNNIQTLSITKRYFKNTEEDSGVYLILKKFNKFIIYLIVGYIIITAILAIICGFFINILILPVIGAAILSFGFFLSFPIHLIKFGKDSLGKKLDREGKERSEREGFFALEDPRLIKYSKMLEKISKYYQIVIIVVLIVYISIAGQILIFNSFSWNLSMEFYFSLPYLGFNVFAFDVKSKYTHILTTIMNLI